MVIPAQTSQSVQTCMPPAASSNDAKFSRIATIAIPLIVALASFLILSAELAIAITAVVTIVSVAYSLKNSKKQTPLAKEPVSSVSPAKIGGPVALSDVERIDIDPMCYKTRPCQHGFTILLKDGRKANGSNFSPNIGSLISNIPQERINSGRIGIDHFKRNRPAPFEETQSPEAMLVDIFNRRIDSCSRPLLPLF